MKHHLVAVLPESLLSAPLDSKTLSLLNLLSVKAILCTSTCTCSPAATLIRLKNIQPFDLLTPAIDPGDRLGSQLITSQESALSHGLHLASKYDPDRGELTPPEELEDLLFWLESSTPRWISAPLAVLPVVRAIMNIHPLDPYLAAHYMRQLQPLLTQLSTQSLAQILVIKQNEKCVFDENLPIEISTYLKLEKKLHRQYVGH